MPPVAAMPEQDALDIVHSLRAPLLLVDAGLRVRFANASYYRDYGTEAGRTIGYPVSELGSIQWNRSAHLDSLRQIIAGAPAQAEFEVQHTVAGGAVREMTVHASRVVSSTRDPMVLLLIEDVTDGRIAAAVRAKREDELERSNEALSHFAGMASHDLREPIRKLHSYAELLEESAAPKLNAEETGYVRRIMSATERMRRLVDAMLALSRVTRGELRLDEVDLGELAREAAADLDVRARELSATIQVEPLPVVRADAALLRLLFQNLIENALKFARAGHPPVVRISAVRRATTVDVEVRDNGIGFDASESERIFAPFHRLHTRETVAGNGMGLAICRRVADRLGGSLTATSVPDAGATFVLSLPVHEPIASPPR